MFSLTPPHQDDTYNFSKADWNAILMSLNAVDFFTLFEHCNTAAEVVNRFYNVLYDVISQHVPKINYANRSKRKAYPKHIRTLLSKKKSTWRLHRKFRTESALKKYRNVSSRYRSAIYYFHFKHESHILQSGDINKFFRYANRKFQTNSRVGGLKTTDGAILFDP